MTLTKFPSKDRSFEKQTSRSTSAVGNKQRFASVRQATDHKPQTRGPGDWGRDATPNQFCCLNGWDFDWIKKAQRGPKKSGFGGTYGFSGSGLYITGDSTFPGPGNVESVGGARFAADDLSFTSFASLTAALAAATFAATRAATFSLFPPPFAALTGCGEEGGRGGE